LSPSRRMLIPTSRKKSLIHCMVAPCLSLRASSL
jgi:hypothetical protein